MQAAVEQSRLCSKNAPDGLSNISCVLFASGFSILRIYQAMVASGPRCAGSLGYDRLTAPQGVYSQVGIVFTWERPGFVAAIDLWLIPCCVPSIPGYSRASVAWHVQYTGEYFGLCIH